MAEITIDNNDMDMEDDQNEEVEAEEEEEEQEEIKEDDFATNTTTTVEPPPVFEPLKPSEMNAGNIKQSISINIPRNRLHPLKQHWLDIYQPIVEHMKLQIRFNTTTKCVELRTSSQTTDIGALQKCADFIRAFVIGFEVADAIALLRIDDLFIDSFEIDDVKRLQGDHLSRAIGRIAGKDGKTKFTIENATKTRIVLADKHIHILGSFSNIKIARDAICQLILGSPPGQVYGKLRIVSSRMKERF
eukprot:TRINITY_DN2844_c0_g1_i1.p1 TRINITY_DN2844_c0_g1~~TRINITY_DN2844_c0_g1_i1.p1  ORF type:complete len:270 (+),score=70.91 TRINITY_DN2844_c0_g1_i1:73-810(+)